MSIWISWLYHYGLGALLAIVFLVAAVRAGALRLNYAPHRWLLIGLLGGLFGFAAVHAVWIFFASR